MSKRCDLRMKAIEINCEWNTRLNDGLSPDKGPLKALKNGLQNKILKYKVCEFTTSSQELSVSFHCLM